MAHPDRKYGRLPDDPTRPKLDLTELAATGDFSMVPSTADYLVALNGRWQVLGNDRAGDCEAVRWANHRLLMGADYPSQDMVWEVYKTQNPDFDPNGSSTTNGPGSNDDSGMSTDELLAYLHTNGGPDGAKVVAYGTIDPTNIQAVERAIALFGGVWVDILVQPGNQTQFSQGLAWTNTGERPEGGHAVLGGGYTPERRFITWAQECVFDESYWSGIVGQYSLVERVYVVIWPEHATKEFISSAAAQILAADYKALTGHDIVWPTPAPTPPAPTPTPIPTPEPVPVPSGGASFLVTDDSAVARIRALAQKRGVTADQWLTHHLESYFHVMAADFGD